MPPLDQIRTSIETRLAELDGDMAALQAARAVLEGPDSTAASTSAALAMGKAKPRRRRTPKAASNGAARVASETATVTPSPARTESPTTPRRTRRKPATSEKRVEVLLAGKLEAMLRDAPDGLSAITISRRANAGYNQVRDLLRELEGSGQLRRTGTRRTSLWQLISEEEHIAQRAAELERMSIARSGHSRRDESERRIRSSRLITSAE